MHDNATDRGAELLIVFLKKSVEGYNPLNGNSLFDCIAINSEIEVEQLRSKRNTFRSGENHGN